MSYIIIMPEDCYRADSGRFNGCIVRKSSMGVEVKARFNEVRYLFDLSPEAIEQAWLFHTHDAIEIPCEGDNFPYKIAYIQKAQKFKMVVFAEN